MSTAQELRAQLRIQAATIRAKAAFLRQHAKTINLAGAVVKRATGSSGWHHITAYHPSDIPEVSITGTMSQIDGFKDPALLRALTRIEDRLGVEFRDQEDRLYESVPTRVYRATGVRDGLRLDIRIVTSVRSDSATCRRIVAKTEMVEIPTFTYACE